MNSIELRKNHLPSNEQILDLYNDAGWKAYTSFPDTLMTAIKNSLFVLTAWNDNQLVGLLRAVGDGVTIMYIQDILVLKNYRRQGIGKTLLKETLKIYKHVRQIVLLTDVENETISFYENVGLKQAQDLKLTSFIRLNQSP